MEAKVEADAFYQRQADEVRRIQGSLESAVPLVQGIQAALADAPIYLDQLKNKDLVLVLGVTGAGKSVLINYLKGCDFTLETDEETGRDFVRPIPGHENRLYAKPGETPDSQTYYPQAFAIDLDAKEERVTYYCDCPGHADTNQDGKAPASRLLIHQAVKESSGIRGIIMCVPFSSHDTRERDLRDVLMILDGLFRDAARLNVPMIFVATKAGGKNTKQFLNNLAIFRASQEKILLAKREQQASPAEIAILEQQVHLLNLITADNALVVDPTKGEVPREAFREKLGVMLGSAQSLAGIDKGAFYISPDHGDQQSLMRLIRRIVGSGVQLSESSKMLQAHIAQQESAYIENVGKMKDEEKLIAECKDYCDRKIELSKKMEILQAEVSHFTSIICKNESYVQMRRGNADRIRSSLAQESSKLASVRDELAKFGRDQGQAVNSFLASLMSASTSAVRVILEANVRTQEQKCADLEKDLYSELINEEAFVRSVNECGRQRADRQAVLNQLEREIKAINDKTPEQQLGVHQAKLQILQKAQQEIQEDITQCKKQLAVNEGIFKASATIFQFALEMGRLAGRDDQGFRTFEQVCPHNVPAPNVAPPTPVMIVDMAGLVRLSILNSNNHTVPAPVSATAAAPCFDGL